VRRIVVFREPDSRNAGLLSSLLGVGAPSDSRARAGQVLLRARRLERPVARVYERLGVAVAELEADQAARLLRLDSVVAVVPNEACVVSDRGDAGAAAAVREPHSWCLDLVGVPADRRGQGEGATVAVLDTGVDVEHPDLRDRLCDNGRTASFVPGESVQDRHGHGTHCVGVVGGPARSSSGTRYGVAPEARLLVGKVLSDRGVGFTDWILEGIDWAASAGARAISLSCVFPRRAGHPHSVLFERVAETLLANEPGTLLLAPTGNSSSRPWHTQPVDNPAACPSLVAVGAAGRARRVASFSGGQQDETGEVNLLAPGVSVHSAWTGGTFRSMSGTSMAVPHVAGIAALYVEQQPDLPARELRALLEAHAEPIGDPRDCGRGLVRAPEAIPARTARTAVRARRPPDATVGAAP
jgi:subtilisin family serine protease